MRDLRWRDVSETIKCDDFGGSLLSSVGPVGIRASNAMAVSSRTFWKVSQELWSSLSGPDLTILLMVMTGGAEFVCARDASR